MFFSQPMGMLSDSGVKPTKSRWLFHADWLFKETVEHTFLDVLSIFVVCIFWIQWCHIQHLGPLGCRGRWDSSRSTRTSESSGWNGGQGDGKASQTYRDFIRRRSGGQLNLFAKVQEPRWWMEWMNEEWRMEGMNEWMNDWRDVWMNRWWVI